MKDVGDGIYGQTTSKSGWKENIMELFNIGKQRTFTGMQNLLGFKEPMMMLVS